MKCPCIVIKQIREYHEIETCILQAASARIFPEAVSSVLLPKPNQVTPQLCHSKQTTCTDLARVSQNYGYLLALTAVQVGLWQSTCDIY